jgi:predicted permease
MAFVSRFIFGLLVRLLPHHRREQYARGMQDVFARLAADARLRAGTVGVAILLARELRGVVGFAVRERLAALRRRQRWQPAAELRWAARAVAARKTQAAFGVALLAIAIGVNGVVFSVSDSLGFARDNYPDGDRLVILQGHDPKTNRTITGLPADLVEPVRAHTDLLSAVHATTGTSVLLNRRGAPEVVRALWVTPGLFEMFGARPIAGRTFVAADAGPGVSAAVVVREDLAREHFGDPAAAVGQTLDAATGPLHVLGVMPATFRYQNGNDRLWRPLDLQPGSSRRVPSLFVVARMAPGMTHDALQRGLLERSPSMTPLTAYARGWPYAIAPAPFGDRYGVSPPQVYRFLLAAAICLLLTACASVASVELSAAVTRGRAFAVASALGASRGALVRITIWEAGLLTAGAVSLGVILAAWGTAAVAAALPDSITVRSTNAIDLDTRALMFMAAVGALSWLVAALPVLHFAFRLSTSDVLKLDSRGAAGSRRAAVVRRTLAAVQVAVAVCLLIGAALAVRSYLRLVNLDKGFDSTNVIGVEVTIPPSMPRTAPAIEATSAQVIDRLRAMPSVAGMAETVEAPPLVWGERYAGPMEIEGQDPAGMAITMRTRVTNDYFDVLRLPLRAGRIFEPNEPATSVIVAEPFAAQYWPGQSAVGRRFKQQSDASWLEIVGIVARVRNELDQGVAPSRVEHQIFVPRRPLAPADVTTVSRSPTAFYTLAFVVRLVDLAAMPVILDAIRGIDRRLLAKADVVDDLYAAMFIDTRIAASVVLSFGMLSLAVSIAGVYGVMAFLVAGRRRELAIRIALGAGPGDLLRHVLGAALRFVVAGAAAGLLTARVAARSIESQLVGVSGTDAPTSIAVAAAIVAAALIATWLPARRASTIDPVLTLRAE